MPTRQWTRRLDSIERALGSLVSRLETYGPAALLEDTPRGLVRRIESVEKNHGELINVLRANLAGGAKPAIATAEATYDPTLFDPKSFDTKPFAAPESNFEAPPLAEPPPFGGENSLPAIFAARQPDPLPPIPSPPAP